jgi:hypothetical protein
LKDEEIHSLQQQIENQLTLKDEEIHLLQQLIEIK